MFWGAYSREMELLGAVAIGIMIGALLMGAHEQISRAHQEGKKRAAAREIKDALPDIFR